MRPYFYCLSVGKKITRSLILALLAMALVVSLAFAHNNGWSYKGHSWSCRSSDWLCVNILTWRTNTGRWASWNEWLDARDAYQHWCDPNCGE